MDARRLKRQTKLVQVQRQIQALHETRHANHLANSVAAEREARQLEHQETLHESTQATFRATEQYGTDFAKNTRPLLARVSGIAGLAVGAVWTLLYVTGKTERAPDPTVIGMLMSMAFTYMGMRTVDAFSRKGKS